MKRFSLFLAVLMATIGCATIAAQEADEESVKDFMEVAVYGGGTLPMGGLSDWSVNDLKGTVQLGAKFGYNVGFDVGHFLTSSLVVGLNTTYSQFGIDSDTAAVVPMHHRLISPSAYLKYYFQGESNLLPYIKLNAGLDIVKFATRVSSGAKYRELSYHPAFAFGVGAGVMYYTFDYGGLYVEANYHTGLTKDIVGEYGGTEYTFGETTSVFDLHAGITVFFGGE